MAGYRYYVNRVHHQRDTLKLRAINVISNVSHRFTPFALIFGHFNEE